MTVWGIYILDRLYDTWNFKPATDTPIRYQFAARRRVPLMVLAALVWIGVFSCLPLIQHSMFFAGGLLASVTLSYYVAFRFLSRRRRNGQLVPWKELTIALCFSIGILVSIDTDFPSPQVLLCGLSMACLFLGNCLTISSAESEFDSRHDQSGYFSNRRTSTKQVMPLLATAAFLISLLLLIAFDAKLLAGVIFVTALGNLIVCQRPRLDTRFVHALSDFVLFLPPAIVVLSQIILVR